MGGAWRGRRLAGLGRGDPAARLRPTSDRVRESLFNIFAHGHGDPVRRSRVLDLFAGTGALGLEALSRGAERVTFVENGRTALRLLAENVSRTGAGDRARVLRADATLLPPNTGASATLVFLDPPYGSGLGARALASAAAGGWLAPGALVVWEDDCEQPAPGGFTQVDHRKFGDTHVTFLRAGTP